MLRLWLIAAIPPVPIPTPVPAPVLIADDEEEDGGWGDLLGRLNRLVTVDHPPRYPP